MVHQHDLDASVPRAVRDETETYCHAILAFLSVQPLLSKQAIALHLAPRYSVDGGAEKLQANDFETIIGECLSLLESRQLIVRDGLQYTLTVHGIRFLQLLAPITTDWDQPEPRGTPDTEQAPEPSMGEILASIRRIITDDDLNANGSAAQAAGEMPAQTSPTDKIADALGSDSGCDTQLDDIIELPQEIGRQPIPASAPAPEAETPVAPPPAPAADQVQAPPAAPLREAIAPAPPPSQPREPSPAPPAAAYSAAALEAILASVSEPSPQPTPPMLSESVTFDAPDHALDIDTQRAAVPVPEPVAGAPQPGQPIRQLGSDDQAEIFPTDISNIQSRIESLDADEVASASPDNPTDTGIRDLNTPPKSAPAGRTTAMPGKLVENISRKMKVDRAEQIEIRITSNDTEKLMLGFRGEGAPTKHTIPVTTVMSLRLVAPQGGFSISAHSPEAQWVQGKDDLREGSFASWRFTVMPTRRGKNVLELTLSYKQMGADGLIAESSLPDKTIEIDIQANMAKVALRAASWLTTLLAGAALGAYFDKILKLVSFLVS